MERKITAITKIADSISIIFNDGESAVFHKFGKDILVNTSPGVLKKTLVEFKKDLKKFDFNVEELRKLWIKEIKHGME